MPSYRKDGTKSKAKGGQPKAGGRKSIALENALRDERKKIFLTNYKKLGLIQRSAEIACVSCRTIQKWRQDDPEFDEACQEVRVSRLEQMQEEAWRRAVCGWTVPGKFGDIPLYSDRLLMFLMSREDPSYRSNAAQVNIANAVNQTTNNINAESVSIIEDPGWYGNEAHNLAAQAVAAHRSGSVIPGAVQTIGLRETVEQDCDGDVGGVTGSRSREGGI